MEGAEVGERRACPAQPRRLPQAPDLPEKCRVGEPQPRRHAGGSGGAHVVGWPVLPLWTEASKEAGAVGPARALPWRLLNRPPAPGRH